MPPSEPEHAIEVHLDRLLEERGMTLVELADKVGITNVNLSILKNNRAKAIRFSTLGKICEVLGCQPSDLLSFGSHSQGPERQSESEASQD
jgi:putative transcriptional regulator